MQLHPSQGTTHPLGCSVAYVSGFGDGPIEKAPDDNELSPHFKYDPNDPYQRNPKRMTWAEVRAANKKFVDEQWENLKKTYTPGQVIREFYAPAPLYQEPTLTKDRIISEAMMQGYSMTNGGIVIGAAIEGNAGITQCEKVGFKKAVKFRSRYGSKNMYLMVFGPTVEILGPDGNPLSMVSK